MVKSKVLIAVALIVGLLITGVLVTATIWPVINDVETGATPEYPDVLPQFYNAEPLRVYEESLGAVKSMENWKVVSTDAQTYQIVAERSTRLGFVDDVLIYVEPVTDFATQIRVRSTSRVGRGDFGQNARNIKEFFAAVDERIGALKFDPSKAQ